MRFLPMAALSTVLLLPCAAMAGDNLSRERVKTGILPNGGFYSLYAVTCSDERTVEVATMDRRQRWCAQSGGELACFRTVEEASHKACATAQVAGGSSAGNEYSN